MCEDENNTKPDVYEGNEAYIFVSYAHKDSLIVWEIIKNMNCENYRIWYDDGIEPGTEWDENIASHVEKCEYFIAFISGNYLKSNNCKDELKYAIGLNKHRLLVYIEHVQLEGGLALRLSRSQSIKQYNCKNQNEFYKKLYQAKDIDKCRKDDLNCHVRPEVKKLKEEIENRFHVYFEYGKENDCTNLARDLCEHKIYELNNEICDKIYYLEIVCTDFNFENVYLGMLLVDLTITELEKRYNTYMKYITKYQCRIATMTITIEQIAEYHDFFKELGLTVEQIDIVLGELIDMGDYIMNINKMKKMTDALEKFQVTLEKRNLFICKNAKILYNDFLRKIEQVIDEIIEGYGAEAGFELLSSNPELLRRY